MKNASKLVTSAMLGLDVSTIVIADKTYFIYPLTMKRIAGMAFYLADFAEIDNLRDLALHSDYITNLVKALSFAISGDLSNVDALSEGTPREIRVGLQIALQSASVGDFSTLSALARNITRMTANQKR